MIIEICAKCADLCSITGPNFDYDGYVPGGIGLGDNEDYVYFKLDTETGKIVNFPILTDAQVQAVIQKERRT